MTPCLALLLPSEGPSWCIEQGCGSGLIIHSFGQRWQVQFFLAVLLYKTGKNIKLVRTVFILLLNLASNQDWTPPCTRGLTTRAVYSIWRSRVLAVIEVSRLTREDTVVLDHNLSKQTLISLGFSRLLLCAKSTGFCTENSAAPRNAVQPTAVHPMCWPCFKQDIRLETPGVLFPPELPHGSALLSLQDVCLLFSPMACFEGVQRETSGRYLYKSALFGCCNRQDWRGVGGGCRCWRWGCLFCKSVQDGLAKFWDEEDQDHTTFRPLSLEAMLRGVTRTTMEDKKNEEEIWTHGEENEIRGINAVEHHPSGGQPDHPGVEAKGIEQGAPWSPGSQRRLRTRAWSGLSSFVGASALFWLTPCPLAWSYSSMGVREPSACQGAWQKAPLTPGRWGSR